MFFEKIINAISVHTSSNNRSLLTKNLNKIPSKCKIDFFFFKSSGVPTCHQWGLTFALNVIDRDRLKLFAKHLAYRNNERMDETNLSRPSSSSGYFSSPVLSGVTRHNTVTDFYHLSRI